MRGVKSRGLTKKTEMGKEREGMKRLRCVWMDGGEQAGSQATRRGNETTGRAMRERARVKKGDVPEKKGREDDEAYEEEDMGKTGNAIKTRLSG